jgi:hypothetical protein
MLLAAMQPEQDRYKGEGSENQFASLIYPPGIVLKFVRPGARGNPELAFVLFSGNAVAMNPTLLVNGKSSFLTVRYTDFFEGELEAKHTDS